MSEEREEEKKRGAAGGGFEQGMRSALEKAPGLAAPSWLTMQSAMAGGAAGGAAAASWRWVLGPAAGAALIGGALWWSQPSEEAPQESDSVEWVDDVSSEGNPASAGTDEGGQPESNLESGLTSEGQVLETDEIREGMMEPIEAEGQSAAMPAVGTSAEGIRGKALSKGGPEPVEVPEDWAELPAEKAASFAVDIESACVGTEIGFRMANPMKDVRVLWNFGDGQFSNLAEPQHVFNAPGTYDITLSITRISDGLIRTRTIENLVTIHPNPLADFTWQVPSTAESSPKIEMRDRSRDAVSATWIIDGESSQAGETAKFELAKVGEHMVQLVAGSPHGCQSVASHVVEVGNRFGVGGAARFSPNGDGRYDRFLPRKLESLEAPFVFRVEDEEGHIVHETTGPKAWDGILPDGSKARAGARFHWTVVIQGKVGPAYFSDIVQVE